MLTAKAGTGPLRKRPLFAFSASLPPNDLLKTKPATMQKQVTFPAKMTDRTPFWNYGFKFAVRIKNLSLEKTRPETSESLPLE